MSSIDPTGGTTIGNMMPGLVSGLDTESMVEKLLSGTQAKIDKQNAEKQTVTWKQEIYRDIITKLDNFRNEYFTFTGNNNLLSNAFYNTMTSISSSSAVKVVSSSTKASSQIKIDKVEQLATAYQAKSNASVTEVMKATGDAGSFTDGEEYAIGVNLDGVKKTVKFQAGANLHDTVANLNQSLKNIWGDTLKFKENSGQLEVDISSDHSVVLTEGTGTLKDGLKGLGFADEASNKVNYNALLSEAAFKNPLVGDSFEFSINGVSIKAEMDDTVGDVINRINSSDAGVRVSYSAIEDKFVITSKLTGDIGETGTGGGIKMEQTKGNLLSVLFGVGNGSGASHSTSTLRGQNVLTGGPADEDLLDSIIDATNNGGTQSVKFHLNGNPAEVTIPVPGDADPPYTRATYIDALNKKLNEATGGDNIVFKYDPVAKTTSVETKPGYNVSFDEVDVKHNLNDALGLTVVQDQSFKETTVLKDAGLSGTLSFGPAGAETDFVIQTSGTETVQQMVDRFNAQFAADPSDPSKITAKMTFDEENKTIEITDVSGNAVLSGKAGDAAGAAAMSSLFGTAQISFNTAGANLVEQKGQNAKLSVNGISIERNSNSFELEGVNIQLMGESTDPITLTTERDTDKIVNGLKDFVEAYNGLVDELNGYLTEDANYRKYAPLTDAQKKELSEKEIENWEKKAKEGLLRNDSTIESMLGSLRSVMYEKVESAGMALYDIGIETSADYKANGKLELDEDKLRTALSNNLEKVQQLFMEKENGIGNKISEIIKENANISSGSPGILVTYAGTKTALNIDNALTKQLNEINDRLKTLNKKYETERSRYWQQFSQMEQALSQLNSQSSWVTQQFSGSN